MCMRLFCSLLLAASLWGQSASEPKLIPWAVAEPNLVQRTPALYPPLAQASRISGSVVLRIVISDSGSVADVVLVRGHPLLVSAAVQAIRRWRFTPFTENGHPIPVATKTEVRFTPSLSPEQERLADQFFKTLDSCSVAYHDGRLDEAKRFCEVALPLAGELPNYETRKRMELSDTYGTVLLARNDASNAVAQFKNEVAITKSFSTCEFLDCALAHDHLASALRADGQNTAAISEYQTAEKILAKIVKVSSSQMKQENADALKHIYSEHATLLKQQGDAEAAAKVQDKATALP